MCGCRVWACEKGDGGLMLAGALAGLVTAFIIMAFFELIGGVFLGEGWRQHTPGCLRFYFVAIVVCSLLFFVFGVLAK